MFVNKEKLNIFVFWTEQKLWEIALDVSLPDRLNKPINAQRVAEIKKKTR